MHQKKNALPALIADNISDLIIYCVEDTFFCEALFFLLGRVTVVWRLLTHKNTSAVSNNNIVIFLRGSVVASQDS